ncbi:hypothetical protein Dimus_021196 [Dionaea muscipula]
MRPLLTRTSALAGNKRKYPPAKDPPTTSRRDGKRPTIEDNQPPPPTVRTSAQVPKDLRGHGSRWTTTSHQKVLIEAQQTPPPAIPRKAPEEEIPAESSSPTLEPANIPPLAWVVPRKQPQSFVYSSEQRDDLTIVFCMSPGRHPSWTKEELAMDLDASWVGRHGPRRRGTREESGRSSSCSR